MRIDYTTTWYENYKPAYLEYDENNPDFWKMNYSDRYADMLEFLPVEKALDLKLLDVGCGMGRAMKHFTQLGIKCLGIEPSVYAAGIAKERGLQVINGYFEEVDLDSKFDVVHIEQVLSHIPDFKAVLDKAYNLLEPHGIIVVEEPNDFNPLQLRLKGRHGTYWITEDHCNYFNPESLLKALEASGFNVLDKSVTYPIELLELQGDRYIGLNGQGKEVHKKAYEQLKNMGFGLRHSFLRSCLNMGIGRDLVFIAKKGVSQ